MKQLVSRGFALLAALWVMAPALALACPGMRQVACGSCRSGLGGYLLALAIGVALGAGSIFAERRFRRER